MHPDDSSDDIHNGVNCPDFMKMDFVDSGTMYLGFGFSQF